MRENGEDWNKQLQTVLIEITGMFELFPTNQEAVHLLSNLEGLQKVDLEFIDYRRIVFESIALLRHSIRYE